MQTAKLKATLKKEARLWKKNTSLYLLLLAPVIYLIIFCYAPMYGIIIAFKDYNPAVGIMESPWVGWQHFSRFFHGFYFWQLLRNTLWISVYSILVNTPLPIILALMLNEVRVKWLKKTVQTVSYAPYFVSVIVVVGMCFSFLNPSRGIINKFIEMIGGEAISFMESPDWFATVYVLSGLWQGLGWWSIIYLGTLSNVDPALLEAAEMDGAGRFKRIWYINIPVIMPVATIMFIMSVGNLMSVGFEKVFLMQTDLNMPASNIISTYVYQVTFKSKYPDFSFGTAVGLFNTVINVILLVSANFVSKRMGGESIW